MTKDRLLAFSDGCIAIFITIILLTFEMPEGASFSDLRSMIPSFVGYVLSFILIGTYWGNHHHLMQVTAYIDGRIMWANLAWLFCLSLVSFTTAWTGRYHFAPHTVAAYGIVAISCTITYMILEKAIMDAQLRMSEVCGQCGNGKCLKLILGNRYKEYMALALYGVGIIVAFFYPMAAIGCFVIVNIAWFVPDSRIARAFHIRALEEKDRADHEMAEEEMRAAAAATMDRSAN